MSTAPATATATAADTARFVAVALSAALAASALLAPDTGLAATPAPDAKAKAGTAEKRAAWGFLVSQDGKERRPLIGDSVVVGSGPKAAVRITGRTISKRHVALTHDKGTVFVRDLGSRFGTLVAGTQLKKGRKMQLFKATTLTFGAQSWRFVWGERGALIAPLRKAPKGKARKRKSRAAPSKRPR